MPSLVLNPLQQSLFSLLNGDATLGALITGVFDNVVDDDALPYVKIGDNSLGEFTSHTADGFSGTVTLDIWGEIGKGRKEVVTIMARLYELLQNTKLIITGFNTVCFYCILNETLVEPDDNRTYHGVQRYNITVTES